MVAQIIYACTFCGQPQEAVQHLLTGPGRVYICDECITLCHSIIAPPTRQEAPGDRRAADAAEMRTLTAELLHARTTIDRLTRENAALRAQLTSPAND